MPRPGHVSQLRQNWSVFEDEAFATKIQHEEINQHYHGNRYRNQQIRDDIPQARRVQSIEEQKANQEHFHYKQQLDELAERDAQLARELAWTQESNYESHAQYVAKRDEVFARNLQRIEQEYRQKQRHGNTNYHPSPAEDDDVQHDMSYHDLGGGLQYHDEQYQVKMARPAMITEEPVYANNVSEMTARRDFSLCFQKGGQKGEPSKLPRERAETPLNTSSDTSGGRSSRTSSHSRSSLASTSYSDMGACAGPSSLAPDPSDVLGIGSALTPAELKAAEAAERLLEQEKKDMEIAKQLQEQLSLSDEDPFAKDRLLAVEAQDHEFAKILQAKEKAKAKRAKEKAKQRKLEKQRLEAEALSSSGDPDAISRAPVPTPEQTKDAQDMSLSPRSPRSPDIKPPSRKPYMHAEAIDSHTNDTYCKTQITPAQPSSESDEHEPHYANIGKDGEPLREEPILHIPTSKSANGLHSPRQPSVLDTDMPIPPYMPMQSSTTKKSASLERRIKKKKEKEGCKQQ